MNRVTTTPASFVAAGPEAILQLTPTVLSVDRAELAVPAGAWFADEIAGTARSALAIPLDDVTGYLVAAGAPPGRWPVSLGIRVDFLADPALTGASMTATAELVGADASGGITRGAILGADGHTIAVVTQRSHLLTMDMPTAPAVNFSVPESIAPIRQTLGYVESQPGRLALPPNTLAANEMGSTHGGVLITGAEFAAMSALGARGDLRTTSIDTTYLRPADPTVELTFQAQVMHRGRSLILVQVSAFGPSGKPAILSTVILQEA